MGRGRPRRKVAKARCPEERLAQRIRAQRDLLRASGGRNFDRLAGQNSPVWHTLFLFYLVVAKKSQKGKQPHAASYEALEAQVVEYMEACLLGFEVRTWAYSPSMCPSTYFRNRFRTSLGPRGAGSYRRA